MRLPILNARNKSADISLSSLFFSYVLSVKNVLLLASRAPTNSGEALACLTPGVPALRKRAAELARIIKEEITAWEKDSKEEEERRRKELEAGTSAMEGVESTDVGLGEKIERGSINASNSSISSTSTSTSLFPSIVSSLWSTLKGQTPETSSSQQSIAPPSMSNARALASSLFGGNRNKKQVTSTQSIPSDSDSSPARFIASSSSLLGNRDSTSKLSSSSSVSASNPSLFSFTSQHHEQDRSEIQSKLSDIQSSLEGSLRASLGSAIFGDRNQSSNDADISMQDVDSSSSNLLSQPENVAFVPKSQRNEITKDQMNQASTSRIPRSSDENPIAIPSTEFINGNESMSSTPARDNADSDSEDEAGDKSEIIQVWKKNKKGKKPRWSKEEKKRKRNEDQEIDEEVEGSDGKTARRRKISSEGDKSSTSSPDKPFVPFDYSSSISVLDSHSTPSSALSKNKNNKKDRKSKDKGKGKDKSSSHNNEKKVQSHSHEKVANGPQPRKKNEMNSGNKSFTFSN